MESTRAEPIVQSKTKFEEIRASHNIILVADIDTIVAESSAD